MTFTRDEQLMRHALDDIFEDYPGRIRQSALSLGLAQAQEAGAHAKALKRSFYVETAETYGTLARDLADLIVNKGFTYSDADVYRFARLAGHFGGLV